MEYKGRLAHAHFPHLLDICKAEKNVPNAILHQCCHAVFNCLIPKVDHSGIALDKGLDLIRAMKKFEDTGTAAIAKLVAIFTTFLSIKD